jgi:hypothetical protein
LNDLPAVQRILGESRMSACHDFIPEEDLRSDYSGK